MKWRESTLFHDLNDSKLNIREDNENLCEILPKLYLEPEGGPVSAGGDTNLNVLKNTLEHVLSVTTGGGSSGRGGGGSGSRSTALALGSDLLILNPGLDKTDHQILLSSPIDFVLWKQSILVVGLSNSEILLINPITYEIREQKSVCSTPPKDLSKRFFIDAYIHTSLDPSKLDLFAIGANGLIYAFKNISITIGSLTLDELEEGVETIQIDVESVNGVVYKCLGDGLGHGVEIVCSTSVDRSHIITGDSTGLITLFNISARKELGETFDNFYRTVNILDTLGLNQADVKLVKLKRCEGFLFVLLSNGHLEILLDEELIPIGSLNSFIEEPLVIHDIETVISSDNSQPQMKLWTLYNYAEAQGNEHEVYLGIWSIFKLDFKIIVPTQHEQTQITDKLIYRFPNSAILHSEPFFFLEFHRNGTRVYEINESTSDDSLQTLINRGNFDKAELLAKKYNKELDIVWKAKVKSRYNQMLTESSNPGKVDELYIEIKTTLEKIKDSEFICGFCISKGWPQYAMVQELLNIGLGRVKDCSGTATGMMLSLTRKKFYTFEQLLIPEERTLEKWNDFNSDNTNMFLQCAWFLEKREFEKCELIWNRHSYEFLPSVELVNFALFFKTIFSTQFKIPQATSLFETIFPFAIAKCSDNTPSIKDIDSKKISALLSLVHNQIRTFEIEQSWPSGALTFATTLLQIIRQETQDKIMNQSIGDENGAIKCQIETEICNEIIQRLEKLIRALNDLGQLKNAHSICISFDEYINNSIVNSINTMLSVLSVRSEVEIFMRKFLIPFSERSGLNVDSILQGHIEFVVYNVPCYMTSGSIPFEERVVTLIDFITSPLIKLKCVLRMVQEWPVPWHQLMDTAVVNAIQLRTDSSECSELQGTISFMRTQVPYRCLLQKYRLDAAKLTNDFNVYQTILRILRSNKSNAYEDALELIKHTGKYLPKDVKILKYMEEIQQTQIQIETLLQPDEDKEILRLLLDKVLDVFANGETFYFPNDVKWPRLTEIGIILSNKIPHQNGIEFFKLREILPERCWDIGIVSSIEYPFNVLDLLIDHGLNGTAEDLIKNIHKLAKIVFTSTKDLLVIGAAYFCRSNLPSSTIIKIWKLLEELMKIPGSYTNTTDLPYSGFNIIRFLLPRLSDSYEELELLTNFTRSLIKAESVPPILLEHLSTAYGILVILHELRDREIPLENNFIGIYKEVFAQSKPRLNFNIVLSEFRTLGESLLRFGELDLFTQIFMSMYRKVVREVTCSYAQHKTELQAGAQQMKNLYQELKANAKNYEVEEKNLRVINLVKHLEELGFSMNAYALRQRDKSRLITKVRENGAYTLASQIALVFEFKDSASWTGILCDFINKGTVSELKGLLEKLEKIPELWSLPEFSIGWLKVSESMPTFKHKCPIPLA